MKQFTGLLFLVSASLLTVGCSTHSSSLARNDLLNTDGDPFAAAAAMAQNAAPPQQDAPARSSAPGYAAVNGGSQPAVAAAGSSPGWSTTRYAPSMANRPAMSPQTASVPQDNVQLTFRASSPLPESQTEVVTPAAMPPKKADIPAIGNSVSRETITDDPFAQGSVTNADFTEAEDENITQLGAEQPSQASPATLQMPVFVEESESEDPFNEPASQPKKSTDWWDQ